jgi:hypothetical protein
VQHSATQPQPTRSPERTFFVYVAITLAAALFIAIVALLYWRSTRNSAHTALLIVEADPNFDGAVVSVESPSGVSQVKTLNPSGNYNCRFILPPGLYLAKVQLHGRLIRQTPLTRIDDFQTGTLLLKGTPVDPASSPPLP